MIKKISRCCFIFGKTLIPGFLLSIFTLTPLFSQTPVDLSGYLASSGIQVQLRNYLLYAQWNTLSGGRCNVRFDLRNGYPLFASLNMSRTGNSPFITIATGIDPRFDISAGSRPRDPWPYIFFDCVDARPYSRSTAHLELDSVKVKSEGARTTVSFSTLTAGVFSGELAVTIYNGSPLLHVEAVMTEEEPRVAYIYDALFSGAPPVVCYKDTSDRFIRTDPPDALTAYMVRHRTIIAEFPAGSLAVFPPPHAYVFPCDFSVNQGFVQAGSDAFGTRQPPDGDGGYRPWIVTQPGEKQHMGVFLLLSTASAEQTLEEVKAYTHGDTFIEIPGYITMTHHYHPEITLHEREGNPSGRDFASGMKAMNVKIVQPLEFHSGGALNDTGTGRLDEMKAMFELLEYYSDPDIILIPGEEPNVHLGDTHWAYIFPHRVYYTQMRDPSQPFTETIEPYGTVYHLGSDTDVYEMLKLEGGIGLTSHPRIKSSRYAPDNMAFRDYIRDDDVWFGSDWKAMPLDLAEPRLGSRSFGVLDDFCQRGDKKRMIGEVDTFELRPDHEIYAHMNINYLKLAQMPTARDWSGVFSAIKNGDFFTTTGEVVIHTVSITPESVSADLEWTFPLAFAEIVSGDGDTINRETIFLHETREFGRQVFTWDCDLSQENWARFEVWDIARNGAFTQPLWLKEAAKRGAGVTSFTLIDADRDCPVPGFDPIPDNAVIDLNMLPTKNLNIRVNTNPWLVGSVQCGLDGDTGYSIENSWPYALASDDDGDYHPWTPASGAHTLTATPYSEIGAEGTDGRPLTVAFSVISSGKGDVDDNASITIVDALLVAQYYVGLHPGQFNVAASDVDCNGKTDIVDALLIARYYVGLIDHFC